MFTICSLSISIEYRKKGTRIIGAIVYTAIVYNYVPNGVVLEI